MFEMDEDAFRALYDRTARALWAYLSRITGSPDLADDLLQETYYRFLRARVRLRERSAPAELALPHCHESRPRRSSARASRRFVRCRIEIRRARRRGHRSSPSAERAGRISAARWRLRPRERAMLWLAYAQGSRTRDIAGTLGVKAGSVRLLLFRARRKLAELLRGDPPAHSGEATMTCECDREEDVLDALAQRAMAGAMRRGSARARERLRELPRCRRRREGGAGGPGCRAAPRSAIPPPASCGGARRCGRAGRRRAGPRGRWPSSRASRRSVAVLAIVALVSAVAVAGGVPGAECATSLARRLVPNATDDAACHALAGAVPRRLPRDRRLAACWRRSRSTSRSWTIRRLAALAPHAPQTARASPGWYSQCSSREPVRLPASGAADSSLRSVASSDRRSATSLLPLRTPCPVTRRCARLSEQRRPRSRARKGCPRA